MKNHPLLLAMSVLALAALACQAVRVPEVRLRTGETVEQEVAIDGPRDSREPVDLEIQFGAGELNLAPGAEDRLVEGTVTYNVPELEPEISESEDRVTLSTGDVDFRGIPNLTGRMENRWDLQLGSTPMNLEIEAGAYQGTLELGGLALQSLSIQDGAADVNLSFSEPNPVEMDTFTYETGASNVEIEGLANANFEQMDFKSGAGDYTLDFSGELQRDAELNIDAGISSFTLIVPEGMSAEVDVTGSLSNIDTDAEWERDGDRYRLDGDGPTLTVNVNIGAGNVELRTR